MPLSNKEKQKRWRERQKADPLLHEQYKVSERRRYQTRKARGSVKFISMMTSREVRYQRNQWRKRQQKHRLLVSVTGERSILDQSRESSEVCDVTSTVCDQDSSMYVATPSINSASVCRSDSQKRGRRKVRRDRAQAYRKIAGLQEEIIRQKKLLNKYRKRLSRETKLKLSREINSPMSKTKIQLRDCKVSQNVRRQILFHNVLVAQIRNNLATSSTTVTERRKKTVSKVVSGELLKKYRVLQLATELGLSIRQLRSQNRGSMENRLRRKRSNAVAMQMVQKIREFYLRDDNSRSTAGKKETITRHKQKKQIHILSDTCLNLHKKLLAENPSSQLSYSTFLRLRPFWVISRSVESRDTCLCQRCDNIQFLANKMHQEGVTNTSDIRRLASIFCCSTGSVDCMFGKCVVCSSQAHQPVHMDVFRDDTEVDLTKKIVWQQWINVPETRVVRKTGKEITVRLVKKMDVNGAVGDLCDAFEEKMRESGTRHLYSIGHQFTTLREMKCALADNEIVMHIDFAENYCCKLSSEIQSFHFGASRNQTTMHNVVAYTAGRTIPLSTLSSSLRHDPCAIWTYLQPVLQFLLEKNPSAEVIRFISDSPATQYRCKKNFVLFCSWLYGVTQQKIKAATWDYMEAGHGKGAPDGVGGVLKRTADRLVSNGHDLSCAEQVYESLLSAQYGIKLFYVEEDDIEMVDKFLPTEIPSVTGTMAIHQLHTSEYGKVTHRMLSCYCSSNKYALCNCFNPVTTDFSGCLRPPTPIVSDCSVTAGKTKVFLPSITVNG